VVAARLAPDTSLFPERRGHEEAITIAGSEGSAVSYGACCLPVPGDKIMAFMSSDKGLVVHRVNCSNVREFHKHPDRCVDVIWASITKGMFPVAVRVVARNTPGVLANISANIGKVGSNIETISQPEANPETATLLLNISVKDRDHMARVLRRLRRNSNVIRVQRSG
ncbi:MAG: ACT domain-containing protein, partial [Xanthomonadales bacterium]|nr:ACT domain-containing protein [Xanthomonadales bacterium]